MGLNFRKSIKLGKFVNLNISKNGIGVSAGVKGARISVNKNGVGTSIGTNGIRYNKRKSFKSIAKEMPTEQTIKGKKLLTKKEFNEIQLPYIITGIIFLILCFFLPYLFFGVLIIFIRYLIFFFRNRKVKKE